MSTDVNRNPSKPNKVAIWSVPRSLSTVLTRSISTPMNCEVYFEYYGTACCFGPERICSPPAFRGHPPKQPEFSFDWVKKTVEKDHHDKDLILLKDPAYTVKSGDEYTMLPEGYKHTFMIRHPAKVFRSMAVMIKEMPFPIRSYLPKCDCIFKEMLDLHKYVTNTLNQQSVIVDADDLVHNPQSILKSFCESVDIKFVPAMMSWDSSEEPPSHWNMSPTFREMSNALKVHHHVYKSTGIDSYSSDELDMDKLSDEIRELTRIALPSYEDLYERRLRP